MDNATVRIQCPVCSAWVEVSARVSYSTDGADGRLGVFGGGPHDCGIPTAGT